MNVRGWSRDLQRVRVQVRADLADVFRSNGDLVIRLVELGTADPRYLRIELDRTELRALVARALAVLPEVES